MPSPSSLPTPTTTRNSPRKRVYQEDELETIHEKDIIGTLYDMKESNVPPGFQFKGQKTIFYSIISNRRKHSISKDIGAD